MADNDFRSFRNRDPIARDDADPAPYDAAQDPLAELARLIGQRERGNESERDDARYNGEVATLDEPAPAGGQDWAADERYAEAEAPDQQYAEDSYVQPRLADSYPADRGYAGYARDDERGPAPAARYVEPAEQYDDGRDNDGDYDPRYRDDGGREDERSDDAQYGDDPHDAQRSYAPRYRDEDTAPPRTSGRQYPALAPQSQDAHYQTDEQWDDEGDDRSDAYAYDDEAPSRSRRSILVIVLAMLGLVLIGAAGAYAYRAMYGGAMLMPSLPPIIKPSGGPTKIVPNHNDAAQNQPGAASSGATEKLVPREEQPVAVQSPPPPPQVLSTIPVPPASPAPSNAAPPAAPWPNAAAPAPSAPPPASAPMPAGPRAAAPAQAPTAPTMSTEPKKIHTVPIHADQPGTNEASAGAPMPTGPAPAARPRVTEPRPAAPPRGGQNAPLSLVPGAEQSNAAPAPEPPRTRVARTEERSAPMATAPAPAPSGGGGYAVQVTSQRSEAEAQAEFKSLQAKFPGQLGSRQPIIHRADLGAKGTYYRAMVGPFGSAEAAASMCSSLKAAGGSCIVQRD